MAIVYFDSSALVKLLVDEPGSDLAASLWDTADAVVSSALSYPEVRAALSAAARDKRISLRSFRDAKLDWEEYWSTLGVIEARSSVVRAAGDLAEEHHLRGYDAVHLASALALGDSRVVVAAWDGRLKAAATISGLGTAPSKR